MDHPWIYIVLTGVAIIVIARFLPKSQQPASNGWNKEMEETMSLFAAEMEQDSEKLLHSIAGLKQEHNQHIEQLNSALSRLEQDKRELERRVGQLETAVSEAKQASAISANSAELIESAGSIMESRANIKIRYNELFAMREQGKSVETIARKLGMNKGEVDLIIQLAKREESAS